MSTELSVLQLLTFYGLLIIPVALLWWWQLGTLIKELAFGTVRMTLQLGLIGLYLKYLFAYNNLWLNLAWLILMVSVANLHILKRAGLSVQRLFWVAQTSLFAAIGMVLIAMLLLVHAEPWYDARYLIPMAGMLLGNCLTGNIVTLERFYSTLQNQHERYMGELLLGATLTEATRPMIQDALKAAVGPVIATMATLGIVTLPGMMTGQILGGADPLTAVSYQIMIMVGIVISMVTSAVLNINLSLRVCFNSFGLLDSRIFTKPK